MLLTGTYCRHGCYVPAGNTVKRKLSEREADRIDAGCEGGGSNPRERETAVLSRWNSRGRGGRDRQVRAGDEAEPVPQLPVEGRARRRVPARLGCRVLAAL